MAANWTNAHLERLVGNLLRAGVVIASGIVLAGGIFYLARHGTEVPELKMFSGEPADLRSVHGIILDAFAVSSRGIIQLGLLLLMFTPVVWVAFLLLAFAKQRDVTYVIVSAIVLSTLLFSLVGRYLFN